jgi:hypothetical protein
MLFDFDLSNDRTKAVIIALIFFALALYNFFSIPKDVLQQMKDRLNRKDKIYADHNRYMQQLDLVKESTGLSSSGIIDSSGIGSGSSASSPVQQKGGSLGSLGTAGFYYLDRAEDNRLSAKWDEVPNKWDPIREHDKYNVVANPIVYQGFGIPLMSDLMCSSFINPMQPSTIRGNGNDRAINPPTSINTLGTVPSEKKSMFYFSDNISAPECCPGPYTTDRGCVCSFEKASF